MRAANFALIDSSLPEIDRLIAAMLQARDAVGRRSWSHPQEPTGEEWWADVLADPRARKRERRTDLAVKQAFYRLADEKREIILIACSKCDWRAAFAHLRPGCSRNHSRHHDQLGCRWPNIPSGYQRRADADKAVPDGWA
jgi:hypothetical protein